MQLEKLAMLCSGILFGLAVVAFPDQFLFSKTVPNSFWTKYFPLPFGSGWFITFIVLVPVAWMNKSVFSAMKAAILSVLPAMLMAVPISLSIIGDSLLPNNLLNQYLWVAIIAVLPLLLHIVLRWCSCFYANKWLTKRFE